MRASIVLGLTILGAGSALNCGGDVAGPGASPRPDDGTGPDAGPRPGDDAGASVLVSLEVVPPAAELCQPRSSVQLTIVARDERGEQIPNTAGVVTYASGAPAVATVSSSGVVTAAAAGEAVITAAFTVGSITRTASMTATVRGAGEYADIAGVWDLTALQTFSQWGMEGTRQTAVITLHHSGDTPLFGGTFADYSSFYEGEESPNNIPFSGSVSGFFDCAGGVVMELRIEGDQDTFWHGEGRLASRQIAGDFYYAKTTGEGGTFTAKRRPSE